MQGLTEGRIVHFVLPDGKNKGHHRAAIVIRVFEGGVINLRVFTDFTNDYPAEEYYDNAGIVRASSVEFDEEEKLPGTWHWIERA